MKKSKSLAALLLFATAVTTIANRPAFAETWTIETNAYIPLGYGATDDGRTKCDYVSLHNCSLDTSLGKVSGETQNTYYGIGNTTPGRWLEINLNNGTAGDFTLSFKAALPNGVATNRVTLSGEGYARTVEYAQEGNGGWYDGNATETNMLFLSVPAGELTLRMDFVSTTHSGGYNGNYGWFKLTAAESVETVALTAPDAENAVKSIRYDNVEITDSGSVCIIPKGSDVVVSYTSNDGYVFEVDGGYSKTRIFSFDAIAENQEVSAPTALVISGQAIAVGEYVQLARTDNVWPSPESDYHYRCNSEDSGKRIGSTYQGSWFKVDLFNPAAGDYALAFKGGVKNATTEYVVTVSNETGYVRTVSVSQRDTGAWTAEDDAYLILDDMPTGDLALYFEITTCSTGSYAGNYGYFKFTSVENMRTVAPPPVENASVAVWLKSANNAATKAKLSPTADGDFLALDGWNIVVEYIANERYTLEGTTSFEYTVSGDINMSGVTLPIASSNPCLTLPERTHAMVTVLVNGVETDPAADGKYYYDAGSSVIVKYRGDEAGTPYGLREYDLGTLSADYALADEVVPLYYSHEAEGTALWITEKLTGNRDVVLYSKYNADFTLDCDWSELTGSVALHGVGNFKFGPNWTGASGAKWTKCNENQGGVYLFGKSEGGEGDVALGGTLSFGTLAYSSRQRFYMFNGTQDLTVEFGGANEDFTLAANVGFGGHHWNSLANDAAGVKVRKVGTGKMTTNLAGAREWEIADGEVEFAPLEETEWQGDRDMYVKLCTNMTVKAGATVGGFYGPKPESGLDGHGIETLAFEDGASFAPNVGETWVVTNATISGTLNVKPKKTGALVNGRKYVLLTAENGIDGEVAVATQDDDFTVEVEGNSIVAAYNGVGAWVVADGETLVYSGAVTNAAGTATTSNGIIIENGGRMVVDCRAIDFPADGTLTLPSVTLPEGKTAVECISVRAPSSNSAIPFMASDGYGYWTFAAREGSSNGLVFIVK